MDSYNLADAKARLSELVARAEAGEEIEIKRRGETVARIAPPKRPRQPIDVDELARISRMTPPEQRWQEGENYVAWLRRTDQL